METNPKLFTSFFPNLENIPFSDMEACRILDISSPCFNKASNLGLIKKSVKIHYRFGVFFSFINIFDIFEYALRQDLFFLSYGNRPEVNELVFSLVDEISFAIDNCLCNYNPPRIDFVKEAILNSCKGNSEQWGQFWLCGGDPFSAAKCSNIVFHTWCKIFEKSLGLIGPTDVLCKRLHKDVNSP